MDRSGPGVFITFEGGEGAGKSTQIALLAARLETSGYAVVRTREPGGTPGAEEIRRLIVTGGTDRWTGLGETLLVYAARQEHLARVIRPALAAGSIVLCDRFSDSTRAYQGYAGGQDLAVIEEIDRVVVGSTQPDLTFVLDLAVDAGLGRAKARELAAGGSEDRFERMAVDFHQRLREGYLEIARAHPGRCRVIDASGAIEEIETAIWLHVQDALCGWDARCTPA